jgi:hypothetical protein
MSSTPFSRTMRSLDADSFGPSLVALIFAMLILFFWSFWFFFARIPLTEVSQSVQVRQDQSIVALFPVQTVGRIEEGQSAYLHLEGFQRTVIPAIIMQINPQNGQVELFADDDFVFSDEIIEGVKQVEVEVEQVSPATLIMRASGLFGPHP